MRNCIRLVACILVALALSACTTTRTVSLKAKAPALPEPVFEPLPVRVAVWYAPELADYRAIGTKTTMRPDGDQIVTHYDVQCGDANLTVLQRMVNAAFDDVKPLSVEPRGALDDPTIDLVVVPKIERITYGTGADVRYIVSLIHRNGEHLTNIFATGMASESVPEERWLEVAMRDAAAQILVRLTRSEKLDAWLTERRRSTPSDQRGRS